MSLQDETFPDDEFLEELNFSSKSPKRFQFPYHQRQKHEHKPLSSTSTNTSSSSTDQNVSSESANGGRPLSELSSKTTASDPAGLADADSKKGNYKVDRSNKAASCQDIHSEYTKRRYKHVESKVAQYIANIKAEDQKRKNSVKFQRHRSMPETLSDTNVVAVISAAGTHLRSPSYSAAELHKTDEFASDVEGDFAESIAATISSSREQDLIYSSHGAVAIEYIDKIAYAKLVSEKERIESYNDHLQTKLDEKISEIIRLKRNVDFLRIELSNCKDKLKIPPNRALHGRRESLQPIAYTTQQATTITKATQTDFSTTPPPASAPLLACDIYVTPDTPDANNNMFHNDTEADGENGKNRKSVAKIQPLSLNFSSCGVENMENENSGVLRPRPIESNVSDVVVAKEYGGRIKAAKKKKMAKSWLRIFGPCARCSDANQVVDGNNFEYTYTQVPLLNESSVNTCRNVR